MSPEILGSGFITDPEVILTGPSGLLESAGIQFISTGSFGGESLQRVETASSPEAAAIKRFTELMLGTYRVLDEEDHLDHLPGSMRRQLARRAGVIEEEPRDFVGAKVDEMMQSWGLTQGSIAEKARLSGPTAVCKIPPWQRTE